MPIGEESAFRALFSGPNGVARRPGSEARWMSVHHPPGASLVAESTEALADAGWRRIPAATRARAVVSA